MHSSLLVFVRGSRKLELLTLMNLGRASFSLRMRRTPTFALSSPGPVQHLSDTEVPFSFQLVSLSAVRI